LVMRWTQLVEGRRQREGDSCKRVGDSWYGGCQTVGEGRESVEVRQLVEGGMQTLIEKGPVSRVIETVDTLYRERKRQCLETGRQMVEVERQLVDGKHLIEEGDSCR